MRISSANFHELPITDMRRLQVDLTRTQREVATGVSRLADDPAVASLLDALDAQQAYVARLSINAGLVRDRLSATESTVADMADVIQRAYELVLQASNGSGDASARELIAIEIRGLRGQLLQMVNRGDLTGLPLFAGSCTNTPFVEQSGVVLYTGDDSVRTVDVMPGRGVVDAIAGGQVVQVKSAGGVIDLFAMFDAAANALDSNAAGAMAESDFQTSMAGSIESLGAGIDHFTALRAIVGGRLVALDSIDQTRSETTLAITSQTSQLRDVDMASAISRLQSQLGGLQAAQQSYAMLVKLSLFDYL